MSFHSPTTALESIANGRDHIQTSELALSVSASRQTIRKRYCEHGSFYGIVPVKIGNRLLWPVKDVAKLLQIGG